MAIYRLLKVTLHAPRALYLNKALKLNKKGLLLKIGTSVKYFSMREEKMVGLTMEGEIKVAPMHKLIKRAGASRVSEEGAIALGEALEEIGIKIAKEAMDYARHAGRKTIKARDIEIATQKVLGRSS